MASMSRRTKRDRKQPISMSFRGSTIDRLEALYETAVDVSLSGMVERLLLEKLDELSKVQQRPTPESYATAEDILGFEGD